MQGEHIGGIEAQKRKKCLLYDFSEYIYPQRNEPIDQPRLRTIVKPFLETHKPRKTKRIAGSYYDDGNHEVSSFLESLRSAVQKRPSSAEAKHAPLQTFTKIGLKSFERRYHLDILRTKRERHPSVVVVDRWLVEQQLKRRPSDEPKAGATTELLHFATPQVIETPKKRQRTSTESDILCRAQLNMELLSENHELGKEMEALRQYESASRQMCNSWQTLTLTRSHLDMRPPKDLIRTTKCLRTEPEKKTAAPRVSTGRKPPTLASGSNITKNTKAPNTSKETSTSKTVGGESSEERDRAVHVLEPFQPAQTYAESGRQIAGPEQSTVSLVSMRHYPTPFARQKATFSTIKDRMDSIHSSLWASLRRAFTELDYQWDQPAQLVLHPSAELESLYAVCIGPKQAKSKTAKALANFPIQSLDLFTALVGAIIHSEVFASLCLEEAKFTILFSSTIYENEFTELLLRQDVNFKNAMHNAAVKAAKNSAFVEQVIRPRADALLHKIAHVLVEHLSAQPNAYDQAEDRSLPQQVSESVNHALRMAMSLVAELQAADEEVVYKWYLPGCAYDSERMRLGTHSDPVELCEGKAAALTLLSRVALRSPDGSLITASPAIVNVVP